MLELVKTSLEIVLAVDSYPPVTKAGGIQMRDLAVALARLGHRVTVLTPDSTASAIRVETNCGVRVARCPSGRTKDIALTQRAINEFLLSFRLWRAFRQISEPGDSVNVFVWYSPTIFLGPLAHAMRRRNGAATYLILRDIFPDWALETGVLRKGLAYYAFKAFERLQYMAANAIGVQSKTSVRYFDGSTLRTRIEVLNNWRDLEAPTVASPNILAEYGLQGKRVFIFGGTLGFAQDLDNLLRLAGRLIHRTDVAILMVGDGPEKKRLVGEAAAQALTNVKFGPSLDEPAFESLLTVCLGGLITLDRRLTSHNVPGKLLSYLKSGLPVLASVNLGNDLIELINEGDVGIALANGDDEGLGAAALRFCDDSTARSRWSKNAIALAHRTFSSRAAAAQVIDAMAPFVRTGLHR